MRFRVTLIAAMIILALAIAGCGSSSSSSSAAAPGSGATTGQITHAKTKFVFHAALAFGAFHHWIWVPAREGKLHPLRHPLTVAEAALAATFVYHELKLALADARADPTLSKLLAPITALDNKIHGLAGSVKSGGASTGDVNGLNGTISSIKGDAASAGQPITEQTPASPSG